MQDQSQIRTALACSFTHDDAMKEHIHTSTFISSYFNPSASAQFANEKIALPNPHVQTCDDFSCGPFSLESSNTNVTDIAIVDQWKDPLQGDQMNHWSRSTVKLGNYCFPRNNPPEYGARDMISFFFFLTIDSTDWKENKSMNTSLTGPSVNSICPMTRYMRCITWSFKLSPRRRQFACFVFMRSWIILLFHLPVI